MISKCSYKLYWIQITSLIFIQNPIIKKRMFINNLIIMKRSSTQVKRDFRKKRPGCKKTIGKNKTIDNRIYLKTH